MTILALAYNGLKALNELIFTPDPYRSVEHLNDDLLRDIGMYRDAGTIINLNESPLPVEVKKTEKTITHRTPILSEHLENNSG
jgi:hypothetical protein